MRNSTVKTGLVVTFIAVSGLVLAQDEVAPPPQVSAQDQAGPQGAGPQAAPPQNMPPQNGGWRRLGPAAPDPQNGPQGASDPRFAQAGPPPAANIPPQLTVAPGTYFTVRVNQFLSSDRNQTGDAFSATLVKPIVVNGVIVADRGQVIQGRVSEAKKAGRVSGTSRLGLELTDMTLVDGSQVPVKTELVNRNGTTSVGRDAGVIAGTTAVGAAAGAVADLGRGAAIGAGAGAAVGIVGVLLTRGNPTIVSPEQVLTFQIDNPIVVSTEHAPQAFRYVSPYDYQQPSDQPRPRPAPYAGGAYGAYYGPGYYPYYGYGYPYYYGPSIGIGFGGFYGGRFYGGRFRR